MSVTKRFLSNTEPINKEEKSPRIDGVDLIQINVILVLIAAMRLLTQGFGNCHLNGVTTT